MSKVSKKGEVDEKGWTANQASSLKCSRSLLPSSSYPLVLDSLSNHGEDHISILESCQKVHHKCNVTNLHNVPGGIVQEVQFFLCAFGVCELKGLVKILCPCPCRVIMSWVMAPGRMRKRR